MNVVLREYFPTVFDYLDRGDSLPPGSRWREMIKEEILKAQFGILLISPAYNNSGHCQWEKDLLVDAHLDRGLKLFPVLLKGQARNMPTGLEFLQAARFNEGETPDEMAVRLVRVMESKPASVGKPP